MQTAIERTTHEVRLLGFRAHLTAPPGILRQLRPLLPIAPTWAVTGAPVTTSLEVVYGTPN